MIVRLAAFVVCGAALAANIACSNPFSTQYEYEEQLYLSVDGRATVVIDASLPALVALRGAPIDPSPTGATDRDAIRRAYEDAHCRVDSVSRLWTRSGRRFAQVQVSVDHVAQLPSCGLLAWSSYWLTPIDPDGLEYQQTLGAPPAAARPPADANWDGTELVAFKLHAPSRIRYQNIKRLDGTNGSLERGNILTWEQRLSDRLAGRPILMVVRMDATSILHTTLWLFAGAFAAAVVVLGLIIWLVIRRGRKLMLGNGRTDERTNGRRE